MREIRMRKVVGPGGKIVFSQDTSRFSTGNSNTRLNRKKILFRAKKKEHLSFPVSNRK
jgi:hypothetical protein